jgi:hypothetical protein|tara:strand:+ start:480 stop:1019 length:540 start_codon:yes stop_codon:yes gene_type:complete
MKLEIVEKAWSINNSNLEEPWFHDDYETYHGTRGQAKQRALSDHDAGITVDGKELTFLNIRVKRRKSGDKVRYEGEITSRGRVSRLMTERNRINAIKKHKEEWFYVQDARSTVGNSGLWWGKNGSGYGCHLPSAHRYTKAEILKGFPWRDTDVIWAESDVLAGVRQHVDMQYLNRKSSI